MAGKKISELPAAGALNGNELVEVVKGGVNSQTTAQGIANLVAAGASSFEDLTGDPYDNTALAADLNEKSDSLITYVDDAGAYTLQASDLTLINQGATLIVRGDGTGDITIPPNSSVAFPVGTIIGVRGYDNADQGSGVTITATEGTLAIPSGMTAYLEKTATDAWTLHNGQADSGGGTWGSITGTLSDQTDLQSALDAKLAHTNSATALTDGSAITLTATKHTLTSDESAITFTITYAGDDITIELTLNAASSTWTFPASALCVSEGVASGDNTLGLSGISGDKYIVSIKKVGSNYYVVAKNFGQ